MHSDPVRTFRWCAADLGVHPSTWRRNVLPVIESVQVSAKRRGVRQSVHEAYKRSRTRPAARRLEDVVEEAAAR
jgi:hypothetical protein